MRRWMAVVGVGLVVLLAGVWLLRSPGEAPSADSSGRGGASGRELPAVNALFTTPVAQARGDLAIRGTVLGPGGPVAGVVVVATALEPEERVTELPCNQGDAKLLHFKCGAQAAQLVEVVDARLGEAPPLARTTTDAEGRYSLEGLEAGAYALWAEGAPGTGLREYVAAGSEGVVLRLGDGLTLAGTVRDEDGAPLGRVRFTALLESHSRYFEVLSGEDGRFRLGPLPPGEYTLLFFKTGLLPRSQGVSEDPDRQLKEVTLYRPRNLSGRVVRDGKPVPGAKVRAEGERRELNTVTDGEGRFAFEGMEPGRYSLAASHEGEDAVADTRLEAQVAPPEVELVLGGGGSVWVRGHVRDRQGRPIPDGEVFIDRGPTAKALTTRTGADASFALGPLPPGRHSVFAHADRFLGPGLAFNEVDGTTPVDFVLDEAVVVEGQVVDAAGQPVPKARLLLKRRDTGQDFPTEYDPNDPENQEPSTLGKSREDGTFVLALPNTGTWYLRGFHDDHATAVLPVTAPARGVRLVLGSGHSVTGEVVDSHGEPVRAAAVSLSPEKAQSGPARDKHTETDARGRFTLRGVSEGTHVVSASSLDSKAHRRAFRTVEVRGPEPVEVRLQFPEGQSVSGVVVDTEGRPLAGAKVEASEDFEARRAPSREGDPESRFPMAPSRAKSDDEGRFTVTRFAPGKWLLDASLDGYDFEPAASRGGAPRAASLFVSPGAVDVRLVMRRMPAIRGRVVHEDGTPVRRFALNGSKVVDSEGAFSLPIYRRAEVKLLISAKDLASVLRKVKVKEGRDVDLGTVVLRKGRAVRGRVTSAATGAPVEGALVDVGNAPRAPGGWNMQFSLSERDGAVRTGRDGTFTLPNVEERPMLLAVEHSHFIQKRIPLAPYQDEVSVALEAGATLRGTLRGAGPGDWLVSLEVVEMGLRRSSDVRGNGGFEFQTMPPGTYVLHVDGNSKEGDAPVFLPRRVQVPPGGTVMVDFEPQVSGATVHVKVTEPPGKFHAILVPGQVAMPSTEQELTAAVAMRYSAHGVGAGTWTFRRVPPGLHTAFVFRPVDDGIGILREELVVPAEGEVTRDLGPPWHVLKETESVAEGPP